MEKTQQQQRKDSWEQQLTGCKALLSDKEHDPCMATGSTYTAGKLIPGAEVQLWALCSYEIPTL